MTDDLRRRFWDKGIELQRDMHSLRGIFQNEINPADVPGWCEQADKLATDLSTFIECAKRKLTVSKETT